MEPGLVHFLTPRCHSRWITVSLWNPWEESTRSCAHSIHRPAHTSVRFITLGMFHKHLSTKQKTKQFDCLMGLCDFPKKKKQEHSSYRNVPQMPLWQDSKAHLDTNPRITRHIKWPGATLTMLSKHSLTWTSSLRGSTSLVCGPLSVF